MSVWFPWQPVRADDKYLGVNFHGKFHGPLAGKAVTVLILAAAPFFLFAVVLGYSRVPMPRRLTATISRFCPAAPNQKFSAYLAAGTLQEPVYWSVCSQSFCS